MPDDLLPADFCLPFDDHFLRVQTWQPAPPAAANQPWLVLLHDSLGSIRLWRDLPAELARATGRPVLAYDRQGYGESAPFGPGARPTDYLEREARTIPRVLAACGVGRAVLLGHSDGGTLALLTAAQAPGLVAAVITIGAHVFVEDVTLAGIRATREQYARTNLPQRLARYHGPNTEAVFRAWTETWLRPNFRTWNIEACLPRVGCPVLVVQGELDEYGTPAQVEAIARQVSGPATVALLPGLGHTPHRQAPERLVPVLSGFIMRNSR